MWKHAFLVVVSFLTAWPVQAAEDWQITAFHSDITIEQTGIVRVGETITVDFGSVEKHGIFRDLPYVYSNDTGEHTYTRVEVQNVRQDGQRVEYEVEKNSSNVRLKIGDADRTITGSHEYQLEYLVTGVLRNFGTYDELYWNITGNDWPVPIAHATATVHSPAAITQAACYQGTSGAATPCAGSTFTATAADFQASNLPEGEGFTIAVGYAPGVVPLLTVAAPLTMFDVLFSYTTAAVALLVAVAGVYALLRRWWRYGRDRTSDDRPLPLLYQRAVTPEYDPPAQLRPAEVGVLMDEKADTLDVSATIIDLASRGHLTIAEVPKSWVFGKSDYQFTKTTKDIQGLLQYEKLLLDRLFASGSIVALSSLKNKFYKDLAEVKEALYEEVVRKNLFAKNPEQTRTWYAGLGIILGLLGGGALWMTSAVLTREIAPLWSLQTLAGAGVGVIVGGVVWLLGHRAMPRKTAHGRALYEQVRGYKLFISSTEKYRAKFLERESLFLDVLPYAIVFGLTEKLAQAFARMGITPPTPTWYTGTGGWNPVVFASSINTFSQSLSTAIASAPRSSGSGGGGSSGGGFGGGGGGSW